MYSICVRRSLQMKTLCCVSSLQVKTVLSFLIYMNLCEVEEIISFQNFWSIIWSAIHNICASEIWSAVREMVEMVLLYFLFTLSLYLYNIIGCPVPFSISLHFNVRVCVCVCIGLREVVLPRMKQEKMKFTTCRSRGFNLSHMTCTKKAFNVIWSLDSMQDLWAIWYKPERRASRQ